MNNDKQKILIPYLRSLQDHIQEIFKKWEQLDDEIWLKVICMERNRRIAKAYARVPLLTINGATNGFDGYRIGLSGNSFFFFIFYFSIIIKNRSIKL